MAKRHEGFTPTGTVVEDVRMTLTMSVYQVPRIYQTGTPTKKIKIKVGPIHDNALLGYVEAVLIGGVKSLNLDRDTE
ncbi:MAG: hypothetical protein J3Q66DRAFT_402630 [Benniella sp.]|nr:MAG: hypothetical protein J3Q66DRAFT_402630 [Benniella sp.]